MMENIKTELWFGQDDCDPDSMEYFEKSFLKNIGEKFDEWIKKSEKEIIDDGYEVRYHLGKVVVIISADHQFYNVYKKLPLHKIQDRTKPHSAKIGCNHIRNVNGGCDICNEPSY